MPTYTVHIVHYYIELCKPFSDHAERSILLGRLAHSPQDPILIRLPRYIPIPVSLDLPLRPHALLTYLTLLETVLLCFLPFPSDESLLSIEGPSGSLAD